MYSTFINSLQQINNIHIVELHYIYTIHVTGISGSRHVMSKYTESYSFDGILIWILLPSLGHCTLDLILVMTLKHKCSYLLHVYIDVKLFSCHIPENILLTVFWVHLKQILYMDINKIHLLTQLLGLRLWNQWTGFFMQTCTINKYAVLMIIQQPIAIGIKINTWLCLLWYPNQGKPAFTAELYTVAI